MKMIHEYFPLCEKEWWEMTHEEKKKWRNCWMVDIPNDQIVWINIWKTEPPRNTEILFMTGDESVHIGEIFSNEKLRKCSFHSFVDGDDYECDSLTQHHERVIYWFPIPEIPKTNES